MFRLMARLVTATTVVLLCAPTGHALFSVANKGIWPKSWPQELDGFRRQSRSLIHSQFAIYEIPFASRDEFEAAWPHLLKLKSKGAPLRLFRGPHQQYGGKIPAGVRVIAPLTGTLISPTGTRYPAELKSSIPGGKFLKIGPPWPESVRSESGELPEYVLFREDKWVPWDGNRNTPGLRDMRRARLELELIVDGRIVDLNRVQLPADTPIIDRRFHDEGKRGG